MYRAVAPSIMTGLRGDCHSQQSKKWPGERISLPELLSNRSDSHVGIRTYKEPAVCLAVTLKSRNQYKSKK